VLGGSRDYGLRCNSVGIAIACLGFALWYEGRAHAEEPALGGIPQLGHTGGD